MIFFSRAASRLGLCFSHIFTFCIPSTKALLASSTAIASASQGCGERARCGLSLALRLPVPRHLVRVRVRVGVRIRARIRLGFGLGFGIGLGIVFGLGLGLGHLVEQLREAQVTVHLRLGLLRHGRTARSLGPESGLSRRGSRMAGRSRRGSRMAGRRRATSGVCLPHCLSTLRSPLDASGLPSS